MDANRELRRLRGMVAGAVLLALAGSGLAAVSVWYQMNQPRMVTVDLLGIADDARNRLHDTALIAAFSRNLQRELLRMSRQQHLVILPRQAVAAGAPDITAELGARLLPVRSFVARP